MKTKNVKMPILFLNQELVYLKETKQKLIPPAVRYFFIIKTITPQKTNSSHTVCNLFNT